LNPTPLSHIEEARFDGVTKQSQTSDEIATPACRNAYLPEALIQHFGVQARPSGSQ
jgi:hypothetical protein